MQIPFESKSSPGVTYTVLVNGQSLSCNCPGYTKRKERVCTHTRKVAKDLGITLETPARQLSLLDHGEEPVGRIEPMLASAPELVFEDHNPADWIMEEKWDGHRMSFQVLGRHVVTWSRAGNTRVLPDHLLTGLRDLAPGTYDGELYIPGGTSTDVTALDKAHLLRVRLFDMLMVGDKMSLMDKTYLTRREFLSVATENRLSEDHVLLSSIQNVSRPALQRIWDAGGEGVVVKRKTSLYLPGKRTTEWVKFKRFENLRAVLVGFQAGLLGPHSKMVLRSEDGIELSVKTRNDAWRAAFAENCERFYGCLVNVEHQGRTKNKFRSPMVDHFVNGELK